MKTYTFCEQDFRRVLQVRDALFTYSRALNPLPENYGQQALFNFLDMLFEQLEDVTAAKETACAARKSEMLT